MSPSWSLAGRGSTPQPLQPPTGGRMFWVKGDAGLFDTAGTVTRWNDQSGLGQNLDVVGGAVSTGIDTIDGIPCVSFPLTFGSGGTFLRREEDMLKTDAAPLTTGPRTLMAMILPQYVAAAANITGGAVFSWFQEAPPWVCLFDLEPNFSIPDGAYAWCREWRVVPDGTNVNAWTPETGGAGGPFNNVPTLVEWSNSTSIGLSYLVNNETKTLTPAVRSPGGASVFTGFMVGNSNLSGQPCFFGAVAEIIAWDKVLSDAEHDQAVNYFRSRYPSAPIVVS